MKVPTGDFALIYSHVRAELPFSCEFLQEHLTSVRLFEPWGGGSGGVCRQICI